MTFNQYQEFTATTDQYKKLPCSAIEAVKTLALGLCEEAGEFAGKVKKVQRDDGGIFSEEKRLAAGYELGDTLWYLSRSAARLGFTLETIAAMNKAKLIDRMERNKLGGSGDDR